MPEVETKEKKVRTPKRDLNTQNVGDKDGSATLVAKNADRQLWVNDKGKYGVVKIVSNKYVTIQRMGVDKEAGMKILETGVVPPKPPPAPKEKKVEKVDGPAAPPTPKAKK